MPEKGESYIEGTGKGSCIYMKKKTEKTRRGPALGRKGLAGDPLGALVTSSEDSKSCLLRVSNHAFKAHLVDSKLKDYEGGHGLFWGGGWGWNVLIRKPTYVLHPGKHYSCEKC